MIIRKATIEDSNIILEHLFLSMDEILYKFLDIKDSKIAKEFLLFFIKKENNQYSFRNCLVAIEEKKIIGSINIYNGARLDELREPITEYIKTNFNVDFIPETETVKGEFYIDSLGVDPIYQGKGIGTKILQHVIKIFTHDNQNTLGLLVDEKNPDAEKLYLKLGFKFIDKKVLAGKRFNHLQIKPNYCN